MPQPVQEPPKLYRVTEVAEILKVSISTVYSILGVSLEYHRCPSIRISQEQLDAYLETTRKGREPVMRVQAKASPRPVLKHFKV